MEATIVDHPADTAVPLHLVAPPMLTLEPPNMALAQLEVLALATRQAPMAIAGTVATAAAISTTAPPALATLTQEVPTMDLVLLEVLDMGTRAAPTATAMMTTAAEVSPYQYFDGYNSRRYRLQARQDPGEGR